MDEEDSDQEVSADYPIGGSVEPYDVWMEQKEMEEYETEE